MEHLEDPFSPEISMHKIPKIPRQCSDSDSAVQEDSFISRRFQNDSTDSLAHNLQRSSSRVGMSEAPSRLGQSKRRRSSQALVFVGKRHGGGIFVDDPGFLAEWSVEAMRLIRGHLYRAGNGKVKIPCASNWPDEQGLPLWASDIDESKVEARRENECATPVEILPATRVTITDLPRMVAEVEELLDVMEGMMDIQRNRRLERLRPNSWLRRNWYIIASSVPAITFVARRVFSGRYGKETVKFVVDWVSTFVRERVIEPCVAM
jgi:hypothetical protein